MVTSPTTFAAWRKHFTHSDSRHTQPIPNQDRTLTKLNRLLDEGGRFAFVGAGGYCDG